MKTILIYILCISCLLAPATTIKEPQYTIYIPNDPDSIIFYYNSNGTLPHIKNQTPRNLFNFQEGIADKLLKNNKNSIIIVTYQYSSKLIKEVDKLIKKYDLTDVIISGWSAGGNNAVKAAVELANNKRNIQLLLIDANDTDQLGMGYFKTLAKYNIPIHYTSNLLSQNKMKVLKKIRNAKLDIFFYKLKIPKDFSGSNHIYCRNCAVNYDLYGYLLGAHDIGKHYKVGYYSYKKNKPIF